MRLAFMGTPDFAVPTLDALLAAGHEVAAVYTQPPRPGGRRGKAPTPSPVQLRAEAAGIEVRTPERLRGPEEQAAFAALGLDAAVVAAYGLILPEPILRAPRRGCLNVHGSLLPRWRGAAPVQRAILAGDEMTGVCIMEMEKGLDTGAVFARGETPIARKTAGALAAELATMGAQLMVEVLERIDAIAAELQPEDGITYAHKIEKTEAKLDFTRSAQQIERQVRAFNPAPGAYFELRGERIKVLEADVFARATLRSGAGRSSGVGTRSNAPAFAGAQGGDARAFVGAQPGCVLDDRLVIACGEDCLQPTLVQRAGRAPMPVDALLRGFPIPAGTILA